MLSDITFSILWFPFYGKTTNFAYNNMTEYGKGKNQD